MKSIVIILVIVLFICCSEKQKDNTATTYMDTEVRKDTISDDYARGAESDPYDFDTILKKGFHLSYRVTNDTTGNEKMQSLTLVKGNRDIRQLNEMSYPGLHKNLGYVSADFDDLFVFTQSFGSGNPNEIQLIDKETGKVIKAGTWVDARDTEGILVYISDIHKKNEQLKIYDVNKRKETVIIDFNNSLCFKEYPSGLRDCVEIDTITKEKIVLKIDTDDERIIKTYLR